MDRCIFLIRSNRNPVFTGRAGYCVAQLSAFGQYLPPCELPLKGCVQTALFGVSGPALAQRVPEVIADHLQRLPAAALRIAFVFEVVFGAAPQMLADRLHHWGQVAGGL